MKNFETKEECEKYIVAEYGECAFQVGVIFAYRVKPIEAKMFGLVEGSYMSSNEFDETTGYGR